MAGSTTLTLIVLCVGPRLFLISASHSLPGASVGTSSLGSLGGEVNALINIIVEAVL